jgi:hypothetical protein
MLYQDEVARLLTLAPAILGRGPTTEAKPEPKAENESKSESAKTH